MEQTGSKFTFAALPRLMKTHARALIGILLVVISLAGIAVINAPTAREEVIRFPSLYEGVESTLEASYYETDGAQYAVLICPGFSCDRQKLRTVADQFVASGMTVMTFDYAGQGASGGVIGFDNAKTNHIPTEISHALALLHEKSGIPYDHILLVGHSMGGRSILKLFTLDLYTSPVAAAILIAPEVDYVPNVQSELFAGTTDRDEAPWDNYNGAYTAGTSVYLISSTFDDTVSHRSTIELFRRLGGEIAQDSGVVSPMRTATNTYGSRLGLTVVPGALHSFQMYAPAVKRAINAAIGDLTGTPATYFTWAAYLLYALWFIGFVGVFLVLTSLSRKRAVGDEIPVLTDVKKFLLRKALLWLPALVVMFLLCCIFVVMPFGSPVLNIVFMGSIAGYGAVLLLAYRKGRFPGTEGKLPRPTLKIPKNELLITLCVTVLAIAYMVYAVRAGLYRVMPFNFRLLFLALAGGAMSVGYYVSGVEDDMLRAANASRGARIVCQIIRYVPIFLYTVSYLALGSFSGVVEQVQNLMFMYVFALPLGAFFTSRTKNRLWGAAVTAFSFQAMMLMSSALIAIF